VNATGQPIGRQQGGVMRGTRRSRWIIVMCRAACVFLASLASACSPSDEASQRPTPTSPTLPTPPTPPSPPTPPANRARLQLSGRVLDQNGTPVPGASVAVDYQSAGGVSSPPSHCGFAQFCWLATTTNDLGEYSVELEPLPWPGYGWGYVYAVPLGYEIDVQPVPPPSASPAVQDMRLRLTRTHAIPAGASIVVSVGATSSLCTDLEDLYLIATQGLRCEIVVIESGAGLLTVEARPVADGPAPSMFWYTTGNYAGFITRPAPGALAIPVRGGTYRILVGIPEGESRQFNVTTTLR
jgi:hypothetical protein